MSENPTSSSTLSLARWIPALGWLRSYQPGWLRGDIVAGITLAAYLLPAGIADASLANLPPEAGLYACLFSGLVFWLFCSSRHTAITVTSAISLLVGASLGEMAGGDPTRFGALAAGTALLVALIAFRRVAGQGGLDRQFHLRKRDGRVQVRRGAVPRQHAVAEAVWLQGRPRQFLGTGRPLPLAPERNQRRLAAPRPRRAGAAGAGQGVSQEPAGGVVRGHREHRRRRVHRPGRARREAAGRGAAGPAGHRPPRDPLVRLERLVAAGARLLPARRGGNGRHRPHVHRQARRPAGRQPGVSGAGRGEPGGRAGPGLSGQRRHVAIARERKRRRAHPALRLVRVVGHAGGRPVPLRPAALSAATGAGGHRAGGRHRACSKCPRCKHLRRTNRTEYIVAIAALLGVLVLGLAAGRADRRDHLAGAADPARVAAARGAASDASRARGGSRTASGIRTTN